MRDDSHIFAFFFYFFCFLCCEKSERRRKKEGNCYAVLFKNEYVDVNCISIQVYACKVKW